MSSSDNRGSTVFKNLFFNKCKRGVLERIMESAYSFLSKNESGLRDP